MLQLSTQTTETKAFSSPLALRPLRLARRVSLFEREIREHLSRAALDALLVHCELLSEGQEQVRGRQRIYAGSTMLTLHLDRVQSLFREPGDAATARRLAALLAGDATARARLKSIATRQAEARTRCKLHEVAVELRVSARGARVLVDADLEAVL